MTCESGQTPLPPFAVLHASVRAWRTAAPAQVHVAAARVALVDDPEAAAENAELVAAIAELPDDFRDALVAVDVAGLSYQEAARLLGLPEGTVTSRLYRARDRLARRLAGE